MTIFSLQIFIGVLARGAGGSPARLG